MPSDLVKARWNGPFDAQMGPGVILQPGDEWEVTSEDLKSGHWTAIGRAAKAVEKEGQEAVQVQVEETVADPGPPSAGGAE